MNAGILAGFWGAVAGSALLLGSAIGYYFPMKQRTVAGVMAFGAGVLITTLSFELMEEAHTTGGLLATAIGFCAGALVYTTANGIVAKFGAKHRKRSGEQQSEEGGSATSIAIGALIDGIPESIVIGLSLLESTSVSLLTVAAIFISNIPEGLSSSVGMKQAGRSRLFIFGIWGIIALACAVASLAGYFLFQGASPSVIAMVMAIAAGAILCMIVDTMIPEAFEQAHDFAGIITVIGFLTAFALSKL